jgi:UrcA family protein
MKRLVVAAVMALAMGSGAAAFADEGRADDARAVPVRYADLNLSQSDDAATLLERLRLATTRACEVREVAHPVARTQRGIEACRQAALAEAVAKLDAPMVTQLYADQR